MRSGYTETQYFYLTISGYSLIYKVASAIKPTHHKHDGHTALMEFWQYQHDQHSSG